MKQGAREVHYRIRAPEAAGSFSLDFTLVLAG